MTAHALTRQVRTGGQTDGSRTYIANRGSSHIECITAIHPNSDAARETPYRNSGADKKDGTTFKFSGDLREAIEKAEKELKEKDGTERHTFLKWQYDNAKKALETYNRRLKDLHDFIRLGKEELEKKEKEE